MSASQISASELQQRLIAPRQPAFGEAPARGTSIDALALGAPFMQADALVSEEELFPGAGGAAWLSTAARSERKNG
jgi:hypothetical protein